MDGGAKKVAFSMAAKLLCTLTTQLMLEEMHDGRKSEKKCHFGKLLPYCLLQKIESTLMTLLPKLRYCLQKTKISTQTLEKQNDIALFFSIC